jgi:hypothetical protein
MGMIGAFASQPRIFVAVNDSILVIIDSLCKKLTPILQTDTGLEHGKYASSCLGNVAEEAFEIKCVIQNILRRFSPS